MTPKELKLRAFKTKSNAQGFHVRVSKEAFAYDQAREISNSYFDYKPIAVAFPRNAAQVVQCLNFCKGNGFKVRLRSGGHQHEGMSSGNGIFMIRLSDVNFIEYKDKDKTQAWIGVGCKLKAAYDELELDHKMIPGGGCWNVNVGGLTQGGGWGMNSRLYGLTCDNILKAEIVLASGKIKIIDKEKDHLLFKALRGGGGGNFGVVTRFLFQLHDISPEISTFSISWYSPNIKENIKYCLNLKHSLGNNITTFLRIQYAKTSKEQPHPYLFRVYGLFHGKQQLLEEEVETLFKDHKEGILKYVKYSSKITDARDKLIPGAISQPSTSLANLFNYDVFDIPSDSFYPSDSNSYVANMENGDTDKTAKCKVAPPSSNCDVPHPHKVSSVFARKITGEDYYEKIGERVATYFEENASQVKPEHVCSYMTFHSLGGKIETEPDGGSGFAFRDREFLMQFQSWWNYPQIRNEEEPICRETKDWQKPYIDWVSNFRKTMAADGLTDGAFINFVDKDVVSGAFESEAQKKYDLLKVYYGDKLDDLIEVKKKYDAEDFFNFEMSIPTKKP